MNIKNQNLNIYGTKKKQHYVPKFYLKFFSDAERKFFVYDFNKQMALSNRVFYESQCYKKYFYGEDGVLENQLSKKEGEWAAACRKIIAGERLDNNDVSLLKEFVLYQRQRTSDKNAHSREEREAILLEYARILYLHRGWTFDKEAESYCKNRAEEEVSPAENVLVASSLMKYVEDLGVLVVHYVTENQLITSDSPVITLNPFMRFQGFGYDNVGVVFLIPISPKDLLVIYDDQIYTKFKNTRHIESDDEEEVNRINRYEMIHSERMVYSSDNNNFKLITEEIFDYREREKKRNKTQFLGPEGSQRLIISHSSGVDYYYELPYIHLPRDYRRIPYNCREVIPRHFEEGWDKKLELKYKILSITNKLPLNNETKDVFPSKTDLKLGCKRMENLAKIYWKNRGYNV